MKKILSALFLSGVIAVTLNVSNITFADTATIDKPAITAASMQAPVNVKPLDMVNNPSAYLNKKVTMTSKFAKFTTLGLDYKRAMRSSDNHIAFLFLRDDAINNIPLSELKMFLNRKTAEKLPDINEGDTVKVTGTVFSNALGDVWLDAESITVINKVKKEETK